LDCEAGGEDVFAEFSLLAEVGEIEHPDAFVDDWQGEDLGVRQVGAGLIGGEGVDGDEEVDGEGGTHLPLQV
jgi:hypothetical protein